MSWGRCVVGYLVVRAAGALHVAQRKWREAPARAFQANKERTGNL